MQIGNSYLQKPQRQEHGRQDYPQRTPTSHRNPNIELAAQASAGIASSQMITGLAGSTPRPTKGRAAIKFVYRWALRLLLFGLLIILAGLILFLWAPRVRPGTAQELRPLPRMTAKAAYDIARPVTLRWAEDSQLLSLSGTWDSSSNYLGGDGDWSLLFFSPSKRSVAHISVAEGKAAVVNAHGVTEQPELQQIGLWRLDSPEVVKVLRSSGGDEFLQGQPQAGLALSLNLVGEVAWSARLIDQENRRILEVHVDADDGEMVEIRQSG